MSKTEKGHEHGWTSLIRTSAFKGTNAFFDVMPLFKSSDTRLDLVETLDDMLDVSSLEIEPTIVALESRGFIIGTSFADYCALDLVLIRKAGNLPGKTIQLAAETEYSNVILEIQKDAITPGTTVVIMDDVLATGGTLLTAAKLIEELGGKVVAIATIIEIDGLGGRKLLEDAGYQYYSLAVVSEDSSTKEND